MPLIPSTFPRIIYLNGPSQSGKSLLADKLVSLDSRAILQHYFASPLYLALESFIPDHPTDKVFDLTKQETLDIRVTTDNTLTWRDALMNFEAFVKNTFGPDYLAQVAANTVSDLLTIHGYETIILPDIKFIEEITELSTLVTKRDQLLIRIERKGFSFENEPGGYLSPDIPSVTFTNDTTEDEFLNAVIDYLTKD